MQFTPYIQAIRIFWLIFFYIVVVIVVVLLLFGGLFEFVCNWFVVNGNANMYTNSTILLTVTIENRFKLLAFTLGKWNKNDPSRHYLHSVSGVRTFRIICSSTSQFGGPVVNILSTFIQVLSFLFTVTNGQWTISFFVFNSNNKKREEFIEHTIKVRIYWK